MKSKTFLTLLVGLLLLPVLAWAQPAPGDSIILESKTVAPGQHPGAAADTAAFVYVKVYITNVDSITAISVPIVETSLSGGAYAILGRPRNPNGCVSRLQATLQFFTVLGTAGYNSSSPDSFNFAGVYDPTDEATAEPPNAVRKAFYEFKFDSVQAALGQVELDPSKTVVQPAGFVSKRTGLDVPVNTVAGILTVAVPPPTPDPEDQAICDSPNPQNGPFNNDFGFSDVADNCEVWTLDPGGAPNDNITPDGMYSSGNACPGDYTVTITGIDNCTPGRAPYTCTFVVRFAATPLSITCPPNRQLQPGDVYTAQANASGGTPPYVFAKLAGPVGLTVSASGQVDWSPTVADLGSHNVSIGVTDACNQTASCNYTISVQQGAKFRICIDTIRAYQGSDVEVSIRNLADATDPELSNGKSVGGFSFLISYDCACLQFVSARKGALLVEQGWEFFTYRYGAIGNGNCGSGCPSCLLRVVAIADVNNGAAHPNLTRENEGEWAVLKFRTTNDRTLAGQCCPISWYWFDCTDNTVSDSTGNRLWVVDSLYTSSGAPSIDFPSNCDQFGGGDKPSPKKWVIFCNGHICLPTPEEIDDRGDLNLNSLGYEIADAVLYENYFIYGSGVLDSDPTRRQSQIAASDVNGDGLPLSVGDLVALIRVITGDANPLPRMTPAAGAVSLALGSSGSSWTLSANSASDLGGLYLKFRVDGSVGAPVLTGAAEGMSMKVNQVGDELSVLIYSESQSRMIAPNAGAVLTMNVEGTVELVESDAADYFGIALPTLTKAAALPTRFALSQNYPNPFNGRTQLVLALPVPSDYKVTVYNVAGQVVRTFEGSGVGNRTIVWDGTDANGNPVSSGVYFFKAAASNFNTVVKGLYLK
jgi:hypothetical protein